MRAVMYLNERVYIYLHTYNNSKKKLFFLSLKKVKAKKEKNQK